MTGSGEVQAMQAARCCSEVGHTRSAVGAARVYRSRSKLYEAVIVGKLAQMHEWIEFVALLPACNDIGLAWDWRQSQFWPQSPS